MTKKNAVSDELEKQATDASDNTTSDKSKKSTKSRKSKKSKLESELEEMKIEVAEQKDKFLRLFAEFDNYKKRTIKERFDLMKSAASDTMAALLPVLDNFDRAKKSAEDDKSSEQFSEGVTLVYNQIYTLLEQKGLTQMETNGEVFDPELHEAITEIPAPNDEMKGKVIDTTRKGYLLNDKILRHAQVVVGK